MGPRTGRPSHRCALLWGLMENWETVDPCPPCTVSLPPPALQGALGEATEAQI